MWIFALQCAVVMSALQQEWPQWQTSSVASPAPSQWALQYLEPSSATQSHVGFAHFLVDLVVAMTFPDLSPFGAVRWFRFYLTVKRGNASGSRAFSYQGLMAAMFLRIFFGTTDAVPFPST
jgi:hypothetical protein